MFSRFVDADSQTVLFLSRYQEFLQSQAHRVHPVQQGEPVRSTPLIKVPIKKHAITLILHMLVKLLLVLQHARKELSTEILKTSSFKVLNAP